MKKFFSVVVTLMLGVSAFAATADTVAITGKIISLEKETMTLKVEDHKVQVSKKYLKDRHAVGEVVTVAVPKVEFHQLVISK